MQELRLIPHTSLCILPLLEHPFVPGGSLMPFKPKDCGFMEKIIYLLFIHPLIKTSSSSSRQWVLTASLLDLTHFWVLVSAVTIHARFKACFCSSPIYSLNKLAQSSLMQIRGSISLCTLKLFLCLYQPMHSYCYFPAQMGFHGSLQAVEINTWEHNPSKLSMCFTTYRE